MNRYPAVLVFALLVALSSPIRAENASGNYDAQQVLARAASEQKFTFLVFYKDNSPATQAMVQTVKRVVDARSDRATIAYVDVTNPAATALVKRFGVSRAPMPLSITVAPNAAICGLFARKVSDEQLAKTFVTPAMAVCMKSMQDGRLVFVCVQFAEKAGIPSGVKDFCEDAEFKKRAVILSIRSDDPAEADFLQQLEMADQTTGASIVFMAPPGVLVGKFDQTVDKVELAAALHAAGKCCNDPNCKHRRSAEQAKQSPSTRTN